ncbi:MAG: DnaJ domain-containing protein [Clostridia bacterium]
METLYDILEVSRKASKEVIEKAYKTLAKKYHPDLQTAENKEIAEKRMKEINEAYNVLSDEQKRKEYDEKLEAEDERKKQEEYINYQNNSSAQSVKYESDMQVNNSINTEPISENNYNNQDIDRRKAYANLSKKNNIRLWKEVQKEANAEYRKQYEDYFRSLGYKIKHKWTFKDFLTVILVIGC